MNLPAKDKIAGANRANISHDGNVVWNATHHVTLTPVLSEATWYWTVSMSVSSADADDCHGQSQPARHYY